MKSAALKKILRIASYILLDALIYYVFLIAFLMVFPTFGGIGLLFAMLIPSFAVYMLHRKHLHPQIVVKSEVEDNLLEEAKAELLDNKQKLELDREKLLAERKQFEQDILTSQAEIEKNRTAALFEISKKKETAEEDIRVLEDALCRTETRALSWLKNRDADEAKYYEQVRADIGKVISLNDVFHCKDGADFEEKFAELLKGSGYTDVRVTPTSGDFGADIIAERGGIIYAIQCKYYSNPVGIEAVYPIHAARLHYKAHCAVVATNNVFTKPAQILAEELGVILWDCSDIQRLYDEQQNKKEV